MAMTADDTHRVSAKTFRSVWHSLSIPEVPRPQEFMASRQGECQRALVYKAWKSGSGVGARLGDLPPRRLFHERGCRSCGSELLMKGACSRVTWTGHGSSAR